MRTRFETPNDALKLWLSLAAAFAAIVFAQRSTGQIYTPPSWLPDETVEQVCAQPNAPWSTELGNSGVFRIPTRKMVDLSAGRAGSSHACMTTIYGEAICWGSNAYGKATPDSVGGKCPLRVREIDLFEPGGGFGGFGG